MNYSVGTAIHAYNTVISDYQYEIFMVVNCVFLSTLIGLFGIVTNVINMVVFYKQGLDTSINITFFALAISDLCALILQLLFNVFANPWFVRSDVQIVPSEFKYLAASVPRVAFTRITCLITVYITMERCLCITFPLHVKQMITPGRTALAMLVIYTLTILSIGPVYCTASIGWKFYPDRNRTLLGLIFTSNNDKLTQIVTMILTFTGFVFFAGVVIFTAILIRKLGQTSSWRQSTNADQAKSNRDRKTMSMVALIASILIICNIPGAVLVLVTFFETEFNITGLYNDMCIAMWSISHVFETFNSSVNIFIYLKMSTKYRETFNYIFASTHMEMLQSGMSRSSKKRC